MSKQFAPVIGPNLATFSGSGAPMETEVLKIHDLTFELTFPQDNEGMPTLEIENSTSAVLVRVNIQEVEDLRKLLDRFVEVYYAK